MIEQIDTSKLPQHIAIIMDGNGRWAKKAGEQRYFGHEHGVGAVRHAVEASAELGINYLTLYTFSTENWNRPSEEINALMNILINSIVKEHDTLMENNIRLNAIGDLSMLPDNCQKTLLDSIHSTSNNTGMLLTLALSYSGKWDILNAVKEIASKVKEGALAIENINEDLFSDCLATKGIPDPELMIRTSGEMRISNFLLWQLAYSELYITDTLWPDFKKEDLFNAVYHYQTRERRFGKTSEQVQ